MLNDSICNIKVFLRNLFSFSYVFVCIVKHSLNDFFKIIVEEVGYDCK